MPPTPTTYLNTPLVYTRNIVPFRNLLELGKKQTIRFVELGDSQATAPGGFGDAWNFGFNRALADFYGNAPETCTNLGGNFGAFGTAHSEQGKWGVSGRFAISPSVSTTPTTAILPSASTGLIQAVGSTANYQSGQLGIFLMNNISAPNPFYRNSNYFNYSAGVRLKTYAFTRSGSSPLTIGNAYNATNAHSFTLSDFQTNINFGQDNASLSVISHTSNLMTAPTSSQYLQIGYKLTSGAGPVEIYGARFVMEANPIGAVADTFGVGGLSCSAYLSAYSGAGNMLKNAGPYNCAMISFGANDMFTRSQAQYKGDVLAMISFIRTSMGDANFPIIIMTDYQRTIASAPDRTRYETYPIAAWEIANEYDAVMAINLQRMTYNYGWTAAELDFTGLTSRGAYSDAAVAYVVNDYVSVNAFAGATVATDRGTFYYKCIANHTSSVSNGPVDSQYWVPISRLGSATDGVHCNYFAGEMIAKGAFDLIVQGAYGAGAAGIAQSGGAGQFSNMTRPWVR